MAFAVCLGELFSALLKIELLFAALGLRANGPESFFFATAESGAVLLPCCVALDGGRHIGINDASIIAFGYRESSEYSLVFFFPFDVSSTTDLTSNDDTHVQLFRVDYSVTKQPNDDHGGDRPLRLLGLNDPLEIRLATGTTTHGIRLPELAALDPLRVEA